MKRTTKRIGILTYYRATNPGVFWQAYATFKAFSATHPDAQVELIRLSSGSRVLPTHAYRRVLAPLWDLVRWRKFRRCFDLLTFSAGSCRTTSYERATAFINSLDYDLVSVGSDTCLELFNVPPNRISPYWLSPDLPCHKMLCAASARDTSYERITEAQRQLLRRSVAGFELLGVRDEATATLLRKLAPAGPAKVELIPDPTFHVEVDSAPAARYLTSKGVKLDRRSILLHLPPLMPHKDAVVRAFRSQGYQVLSFSPLHEADVTLFDLSPLEWAGIFRFVEATVTSRFHDSVFSLKHGTPVLTLVPAAHYIAADGDSKYRSLHREYGLESLCLVEQGGTLDAEALTARVSRVLQDWNRDKVTARGRELGRAYLDHVRKSERLLG
jgi:hypothetical protein